VDGNGRGHISGAGATFPYPVYAKWADAYKKETGIGLNYQSIGSGGGIKQIKAKTVTFGASTRRCRQGARRVGPGASSRW
jgi:ABC-type phosphate transport system substrate-binding protein